MCLQFIMLPFIGFCVVRIFDLDTTYGIMLQVMTACPGGAYSNWWCSVLNADLLLSVTSTAVATVLSAGMLPLNLLIYLSAVYDLDALGNLRFDKLLLTICLVITAVLSGYLASSYLFPHIPTLARHPQRVRDRCGHFGNLCGLCLILFSFVFSSVKEPIWDRSSRFYGAVATPPICALVLALALSSLPPLNLPKPARCAVTVECCFQNIGIGLAAALALFDGDEAATAAGVPLFYGLVQSLSVPLFLLSAWQLGWTYAPAHHSLWSVVVKNYQPHHRSIEGDAVRAGDIGLVGASNGTDVRAGFTTASPHQSHESMRSPSKGTSPLAQSLTGNERSAAAGMGTLS